MIGREEICNVFDYLIQTIHMTNTNLNLRVKIGDDTVVVGNILQHAKQFHQKLVQEQERIGGGDVVVLTQNAYMALMKKIEEADRVISASRVAVGENNV